MNIWHKICFIFVKPSLSCVRTLVREELKRVQVKNIKTPNFIGRFFIEGYILIIKSC